METTDKAANSAHEAFDRSANATNQSAETLGEKDVHLKHTEQQLLKNCLNYVRYNPSLGNTVATDFQLSRR